MITQGNILVGLGDGFIKVGPYGSAEGSCVDLGATEGGAGIEIPREYYEKTCDQKLGVLEMIKTSQKASLKVTIAEATLDNARIGIDLASGALVASKLSVGGSNVVSELTIYLNVPGPVGGTRKYTFHKCVSVSAAPHSYKKDDKTMIELEFAILEDTAQALGEEMFQMEDTGGDVIAPTVALTTPVGGGTVVKEALSPVIWTITEANPLAESTIKYGDDEDATFAIYNITAPGTPVLVAGSIAYDSVAKTVTFTPDVNWVASDDLMAVVTTGLKDVAGNNLATQKVEAFSVTA